MNERNLGISAAILANHNPSEVQDAERIYGLKRKPSSDSISGKSSILR